MKERPILFSAPMVRAIIDGRKTQTRRIMKPLPSCQVRSVCNPSDAADPRAVWIHFPECPRGKPGDRLWVKETWTGAWHQAAVQLHYAADGSERMAREAPTEYVLPKAAARAGKWVTPLFMPRWASRITLEITDVRVQRLQDISAVDAEAEGVFAHLAEHSIDKVFRDLRGAEAYTYFGELWESINGKLSWNANPWVWALTFRAIT